MFRKETAPRQLHRSTPCDHPGRIAATMTATAVTTVTATTTRLMVLIWGPKITLTQMEHITTPKLNTDATVTIAMSIR